MTAAVPLVERLAEVLRAEGFWATHADRWNDTEWQANLWANLARALLPVVEQAVAEARGEGAAEVRGRVEAVLANVSYGAPASPWVLDDLRAALADEGQP